MHRRFPLRRSRFQDRWTITAGPGRCHSDHQLTNARSARVGRYHGTSPCSQAWVSPAAAVTTTAFFFARPETPGI
jgi:hypothetical protein